MNRLFGSRMSIRYTTGTSGVPVSFEPGERRRTIAAGSNRKMNVPAGSAWKSDRPRALASACARVIPSAENGSSVELPSAPTARKVCGSRTSVSTSLGRR